MLNFIEDAYLNFRAVANDADFENAKCSLFRREYIVPIARPFSANYDPVYMMAEKGEQELGRTHSRITTIWHFQSLGRSFVLPRDARAS